MRKKVSGKEYIQRKKKKSETTDTKKYRDIRIKEKLENRSEDRTQDLETGHLLKESCCYATWCYGALQNKI